ncbi:hypothetical protein K6959_11570 [Bacillus aquiflavi]|nr:colicin D domain-containing protein [Bacillus aquiflavi]UAC47345.1 hypothetical protein K6959_11570 [Bacillus aquiflavi]
MPAYATGVVGTRGVRLAEEQIYRISGGKVSAGVGGTGKKIAENQYQTISKGSTGAGKLYNLPEININKAKLQKKYKHAGDFGIKGNYNKVNAELFEKEIIKHVEKATNIFKSNYRGQEVYVYIKDGIGVYTGMKGEFISGWKFNQKQLEFHVENGIRIK